MKIQTKRILSFIVALFLCLNLWSIDTRAAGASVTIALSSSTVSVGKNVTATISVSGSDISAYTIYVSYNSDVLQFNSGSGSAQVGGGGGTLVLSGTGAGSVSLSFTAVKNGSSSISTSGSEVYDINLNQLSISHAGVTVTVSSPAPSTENNNNNTTENTDPNNENPDTTEENGLSSNCNLKSLVVSPGTLSPSFSKSKTNYQVQLEKDATSIVVSAAAEDEKASTSVTGANSLKPGENTVKVTVTAENGAVKVYKINVICGEAIGAAVVSIAGKEYKFTDGKSLLEVPEGFTEATTQFREWEVPAYRSPNKKFFIVCLADPDGNAGWYYFSDNPTPYIEYSSSYSRYIISEIPADMAAYVEIPEGYYETEIDMGHGMVKAYTRDEISGIYLVWGMNIEDEAGPQLYYYDAKEKSFMRYVESSMLPQATEEATPDEATVSEPEPLIPTAAEPKDEGIFSKTHLIYMLIAATVLFIIMCIVVIVLVVKNSHLKYQLDMDDEEDNHDSSDLRSEEWNPAEEKTKDQQDAQETGNVQSSDTDDLQGYEINGIILEDAESSGSETVVPEVEEEKKDPLKEAMRERPFGIDSAFDVVPDTEKTAQVQNGPRIEVPTANPEDEDEF